MRLSGSFPLSELTKKSRLLSWQERFPDRESFHREVKRLCMECGFSYSRAAMAIGFGTTKNQIVRAMQTILGRSRTKVKFPDSVWPSEPKTTDEKIPEKDRQIPVHLLNVGHGQCRAPLWPDFLRSAERVDPSGHMFCGKACKEGSSFCAEHHAVFFSPPPPRKKKEQSKVQDNSRYFG